ncbi:MAG: hypothetical protein QOF71_3680 [Candidatus Eremiobacteraeota bacterium]|jgi:hypothetical protein|nr:hypothetical protein [Candidatus Eremiobacteraeota bacterium]
MRPVVNPDTGLLEWPEPAPPSEPQRRRIWWSWWLWLPAACIAIAMLISSLRSLPRAYDELRYAGSVFALVLAIVVVGLAVWVIAHEEKPTKRLNAP